MRDQAVMLDVRHPIALINEHHDWIEIRHLSSGETSTSARIRIKSPGLKWWAGGPLRADRSLPFLPAIAYVLQKNPFPRLVMLRHWNGTIPLASRSALRES